MAAIDPVGHKVVVRRVTGGGGRPGPVHWSDVVGVLVGAGPSALTVRRRDGSLVHIARSEVGVMKSVPAAPRDVLALEEVAVAGWPAPETRWLGRWLLRAAEGWTGRANSVLPLGDPGLPLDAALAEVAAWYAERGQPARMVLPVPARELLDAALAERGWTSYNPTQVRTADLEVLLRDWPEPDLPVTVDPEPSPEWLGLYHYRGGAELPPVARRVLVASRQVGFAVLRDGGVPVAVARGSVDEGWVGVTAVEVEPTRRRQGLGSAVMRGILGWGRAAGAHSAYLQVAEENAGALGLYDTLGFARHHGYHYRLAPS
jgi:GNAT superfamily N-acetyltransferase